MQQKSHTILHQGLQLCSLLLYSAHPVHLDPVHLVFPSPGSKTCQLSVRVQTVVWIYKHKAYWNVKRLGSNYITKTNNPLTPPNKFFFFKLCITSLFYSIVCLHAGHYYSIRFMQLNLKKIFIPICAFLQSSVILQKWKPMFVVRSFFFLFLFNQCWLVVKHTLWIDWVMLHLTAGMLIIHSYCLFIPSHVFLLSLDIWQNPIIIVCFLFCFY